MKLSLQSLRTSGSKKLVVIPYVCTFANALFGFWAIIEAVEGHYLMAAYCIIASAFMDMLDGRLARALGLTSLLGMELDSLCDAVSFCLAPTIVMYSWYFHELGWLGMVALMLYLCAGLFRLAKFNCTSTSINTYFSGLPTPVAALLLMSLIIYGYKVLHGPLVVIILALLMVSCVQFPSGKKCIRNSRLRVFILAGMFGSTVCIVHGYPLLIITLLGYILGGCLSTGIRFVRNYW